MAHSSSMSAPRVGWSSTSRRTDACQYGSRDEFAIIEARQATPIETSSPLGATRLLWQAMHSLEGVNIGASCAAGPARLVACAATGDPVVMKTAASHNTSA